MSPKVIFYPVTDKRKWNPIFSNLSRPSTLDTRILALLRFQNIMFIWTVSGPSQNTEATLNYYNKRARKESWFC
jgi:hypothetical protein